MQALVTAPGSKAIVSEVPIPQPGPGEIRVRVKTIALNPVDALYVAEPSSAPGRVVGSDFAGVVEALGDRVDTLKIGDRLAGFLHGACQETVLPGAFAEYLVIAADLVYKVPSNISLEEASTIPLCLNTASNVEKGLFRVLDLIPPWIPSTPGTTPNRRPGLLVYSGATSVGSYAIQLARLSPSAPLIIATASPSNTSYLQSLGANCVLDYHDNEWVDQARDIASNEGAELKWAIDCISEGNTVEQISHVFSGKGKIAAVRSSAMWSQAELTEGVEAEYMSVWTMLGKEFRYNGKYFPPEPTHRALAASTYAYISESNPKSPLSEGTLKPNRVRWMPGGLANIPEAFPLLGFGKLSERMAVQGMRPLSAEKMVYRLEKDNGDL